MTFGGAFQQDAFQNNAFQIGLDAGGGWIDYRRKEPKAKRLEDQYNEIFPEIENSASAAELVSAVDPYVVAETGDEVSRRQQARYVVDKAPAASRIDFLGLWHNELARTKLEFVLQKLKAEIAFFRQKRREEEEIVMLILMGA